MRLNATIGRLTRGEPVFSTIPITNGAVDELAFVAKSDFDLAMVECEHSGFDSLLLRTSLQYLLSRAKIAKNGAGAGPAPFVRVPANTRETSEWVIKQVLDAGAMGLILPHLDTVEGAEAAVRAARYPIARGVERSGPDGLRGWNPFVAADYWGLSPDEYYERADIWPLNPDGEVLLMGIVESVAGVRALPDILSRVKGIGAIWAGSGDLSVSMGVRGDSNHPDVEREVLEILRICKDHGVPCATPISRAFDVEARLEQGFEIVLIPMFPSAPALQQGLAKIGRPSWRA